VIAASIEPSVSGYRTGTYTRFDLAATEYNLKKKCDFWDVKIVRELASDLPQVVCDGQQIQQVVLNLVRNVAQAMANVGRSDWPELRPRLTLSTSFDSDQTQFGCGWRWRTTGQVSRKRCESDCSSRSLTPKMWPRGPDWGGGCVGPSSWSGTVGGFGLSLSKRVERALWSSCCLLREGYMSTRRILIVDDEPLVRVSLADFLRTKVFCAACLEENLSPPVEVTRFWQFLCH
jgi:hypothetical protein